MMRARLASLALSVAVSLAAAIAAAQAPAQAGAPPRDPAGAEALFTEGKRLMDAGQAAAACPKFEESMRLDPGVGTLLNLAACREKEGKIATAWGHYRDAESQLKQDADTRRAAFANERANALEPRLPMLVVTVDTPPEGLVVSRDGVDLSAASLGSRLPVDPGEHQLKATAPGRITHERKFVAKEREIVQLRIAELEVAPPAEPPPLVPLQPTSTPPVEPSTGSTQKTIAFILGGVGVASMVAGLVFVGATAAQKSAADDNCPTVTTCNVAGYDAIATAKDLALAADITIIGGAVVTGAGVVLYITAPKPTSGDPAPQPNAVWLSPTLSPRDLGVNATARF